MPSETPLVSILTPSYNQARWLDDNLRSVARQTYPHIEHVVMDGASTDGSVDVLKDAGRSVRWRSEPDKGQSDALNKAFTMSKGDIIGWLNSDDAYFHVDAVADAVHFFERNPHVDVVYGHAALANASGLILQLIWVPPFNERLLHRLNFIIQPTVFIRRTALGSSIVDDTYQFVIDRELWLRLANKRRIFGRIDGVVAIDRHHPLRKSEAQRPIEYRESERLVREYGVPDRRSRRYRSANKILKILLRFAGLRLLARRWPQFAFAAETDTRARLLRRQIAMRRASMPDGM